MKLKKHLVQFIVLATGGPVHYDGKEIKSVHAGMKISNPEFDAVLGDLKASLDRLQIPTRNKRNSFQLSRAPVPKSSRSVKCKTSVPYPNGGFM